MASQSNLCSTTCFPRVLQRLAWCGYSAPHPHRVHVGDSLCRRHRDKITLPQVYSPKFGFISSSLLLRSLLFDRRGDQVISSHLGVWSKGLSCEWCGAPMTAPVKKFRIYFICNGLYRKRERASSFLPIPWVEEGLLSIHIPRDPHPPVRGHLGSEPDRGRDWPFLLLEVCGWGFSAVGGWTG